VNIPPPQLTVSSPEEYERAIKNLAVLKCAKKGSVEEAIRIGLEVAVKAWEARARS
jgi:hypothetical protein